MNNKRSPSALYFLYFLFVDIVDKRQMSALQFGYFCPQKSDIMTFLNKIQRNILNTILITLSRILITDRDREVKKDINAINEGVKDIERKENSNQTVEVN